MGTHRRQFMKTASMFAIGLGMPAVGAKLATAATRIETKGQSGKVIDIFKKESFTPYLNTSFRIRNGASSVDVRLVQISDFKAESAKPSKVRGKENFSLIFQSSTNSQILLDKVYSLDHGSLGTFPMFLVGIGRTDVARKYEATITRL